MESYLVCATSGYKYRIPRPLTDFVPTDISLRQFVSHREGQIRLSSVNRVLIWRVQSPLSKILSDRVRIFGSKYVP